MSKTLGGGAFFRRRQDAVYVKFIEVAETEGVSEVQGCVACCESMNLSSEFVELKIP